MAERFGDRTAIVTGAGSGIGRAVAHRIASEGGRVVAVDLSGERLEALAAELDVTAVEADVTEQHAVDEVVRCAGERVDALANVAGIMDGFHAPHEVDDATWERVLAVNLTGPLRLTRAVLPAMMAAGAGAIVNPSSASVWSGVTSPTFLRRRRPNRWRPPPAGSRATMPST